MERLLTNLIGTQKIRLWTTTPERCVVGTVTDVEDGVAEILQPPSQQIFVAAAHITRIELIEDY